MSKLEVDKIDPQSGTALEIGTSGDTVTIPSGVTLDASNATTSLPATVVTTTGTQTLTNKSIATTQLTGTITPSDATVTTDKIVDANVTLAKLSATGTKDATTFLRGDNTFAEAGGGQFEFVSRATVTSDVAQVVFTNLTADTYHKFVLQGVDSDNNGGEDFCFQLSTNNGSSYLTANSYKWSYFQNYASGSTNCTGNTGTDKMCMFDGFHTSDIDEGIFAEVMLNNVGNGQKPIAYWKGGHMADSSTGFRSTDGAGIYESGVSVNAIKFFFDTGDINLGAYTFITHYKGIIS